MSIHLKSNFLPYLNYAVCKMLAKVGAEGGIRTRTARGPTDFKSVASACSATSAQGKRWRELQLSVAVGEASVNDLSCIFLVRCCDYNQAIFKQIAGQYSEIILKTQNTYPVLDYYLTPKYKCDNCRYDAQRYAKYKDVSGYAGIFISIYGPGKSTPYPR